MVFKTTNATITAKKLDLALLILIPFSSVRPLEDKTIEEKMSIHGHLILPAAPRTRGVFGKQELIT